MADRGDAGGPAGDHRVALPLRGSVEDRRTPTSSRPQPFLDEAKGPAAPLFYAMVPDIDGRQRLAIETSRTTKGTDGHHRPDATSTPGRASYDAGRVAKYGLDDEQKAAGAERSYEQYEKSLDELSGREPGRHRRLLRQPRPVRERRKAAAATTAPITRRSGVWDEQQEAPRRGRRLARRARRAWARSIEHGPVEPARRGPAQGRRRRCPVGPWTAIATLMDLAVTYGLTAIGLCLMLGFCTRLAAWAGRRSWSPCC